MRARDQRNGFALVGVLLILVMAVVLVVAFTLTMRTERVVASNMVNTQKTDLIVQSALANAISLLATNIPDPVNPTLDNSTSPAKNWFVNPGRLSIIEPSGPRPIPLYSGEVTARDPMFGINLNAVSQTTQQYPITGANDEMWVSWVNVLQNPGDAPSSSNRLVGRYAFWIDDECAKININTARGKPSNVMAGPGGLPMGWATSSGPRDLQPYLTPLFTIPFTPGPPGTTIARYALGHPASVNLDTVGVDIEKLQNDIAQAGYLTSSEAIKNYVTNPEAFYEAHKFNLTAFSRSPEFNVFGKSRFFMQKSETDLSNGPVYQHMSHPEQTGILWGEGAGMADGNSNERRQVREPVVRSIAKFLERTDWPGYEVKSFRWTTPSAGPTGLLETDQIALNIASMGNWATCSTATGGDPYPGAITNRLFRTGYISGAFQDTSTPPQPPPGPDSQLGKGGLTGSPMMPPHPGPLLTEAGIQLFPAKVSSTSTQWWLSFRYATEFTLPPGYLRTESGGSKYYANSTSGNYELRILPTYIGIEISTAAGTVTNQVLISDTGSSGSLGGLRASVPTQVFQDSYTERYSGSVYVSNLTSKLPITSGASTTQRSRFTGPATVRVKMRLAVGTTNSQRISQFIPIAIPPEEWPTRSPAVKPISANDADATLNFTFQIDPSNPGAFLPTTTYLSSFEVIDPVVHCEKRFLTENKLVPPTTEKHSLGDPNPETVTPGTTNTYTASAASKRASWDFSMGNSELATYPFFRGTSIGMYSLIPTGIQRGNPWETFKFHSYALASDDLPDWVVLDLFAPTFSYPISFTWDSDVTLEKGKISSKLSAAPSIFSRPISYMNSTAGKINLNSKIYPDTNQFFKAPDRLEPLSALFKHMPNGDIAAQNILDFQKSGGYFDYIGKMCTVSGLADSTLSDDPNAIVDFQKEVLIRNMASILTTQSNVFGIWGVAQGVHKKASNISNNPGDGVFEPGDVIVGEKRFYAVVERYVWQGKDGSPGNAKVDSNGNYTSTASGGKPGSAASMGGTWAAMDGPQTPSMEPVMGTTAHTSSTAESADNPLAPLMKYKVIYFKYID